eukprot:1732595-Rhodomonas_salina.1
MALPTDSRSQPGSSWPLAPRTALCLGRLPCRNDRPGTRSRQRRSSLLGSSGLERTCTARDLAPASRAVQSGLELALRRGK